MASVHRRATARRDLIAHAVHLAENAQEGTAERFLDKAEASFETLAGQPAMGVPLTLRRPELAGLRKWRIDGFEMLAQQPVSCSVWSTANRSCCTGSSRRHGRRRPKSNPR